MESVVSVLCASEAHLISSRPKLTFKWLMRPVPVVFRRLAFCPHSTVDEERQNTVSALPQLSYTAGAPPLLLSTLRRHSPASSKRSPAALRCSSVCTWCSPAALSPASQLHRLHSRCSDSSKGGEGDETHRSGSWRRGIHRKRRSCAACGTNGGRNDGRGCRTSIGSASDSTERAEVPPPVCSSARSVPVGLGVAQSEGGCSLLDSAMGQRAIPSTWRVWAAVVCWLRLGESS